jgi:hypothetical protein
MFYVILGTIMITIIVICAMLVGYVILALSAKLRDFKRGDRVIVKRQVMDYDNGLVINRQDKGIVLDRNSIRLQSGVLLDRKDNPHEIERDVETFEAFEVEFSDPAHQCFYRNLLQDVLHGMTLVLDKAEEVDARNVAEAVNHHV